MESKEVVVQSLAKCAGVATLETRGLDRLDFYDVAVWTIKKIIEKAYEAGYEAGLKKTST